MTESSYPRHIATVTKDFAGREWLFGEIQSWLSESQAPQIFLVTGPPGSGKTAIAARLMELSAATQKGERAAYSIPIAAAYFCSASDLHWSDPRTFINSIVDQLASRFSEFRSAVLAQADAPIQIEGRVEANVANRSTLVGVSIQHLHLAPSSPQEAYVRFLLGPLRAAFSTRSADEPVVILIDALDEAAMYRGPPPNISDLVSLSREFPPCIRLILTSRPNTDILRRLDRHTPPPRRRGLASDALKLGQDDARTYLENRIRCLPDFERRLEIGFSKSDFVEAVADKCNANFLFLRSVLTLILPADQIIAKASLDAFPSDINGIYLEFLDRLTWGRNEDWSQLLQPILGVLSVSGAALGVRHLAAFSALSDKDVRTVLAGPIRQLLDEHTDDDTRYTLYHRSFADFLADAAKSQEFWCDPAAENRRIAGRILNDYARNPAGVYGDTYAVAHGVSHMALAALDGPAGQLLADFNWLMAKVTKTDVIALLSDFDRISCSAELAELREAIELSQHVLAQDPEQLGPQLEARLVGEPDTLAAAVLAQVAQRGGRRLALVSKSLTRPHGPEIATLLGHAAPVAALASEDSVGKLYSADVSGRIVIWNLADRRERTRLETGSAARALALPSRDVLASGHDDGTIRLWSRTGEPLGVLGTAGPVVGLASAAEGLLVSATSNYFQVWDIATRKLLHSAPAEIFSLAATRSNRAVTLTPSELRVWDVGTGKTIRTIAGRFGVLAEDTCTQAGISNDGRRAFISKGHDGVSVYDLDSAEIETSSYHQWVNSVQMFADGRRAAVSFSNLSNEIAIIDLTERHQSSSIYQAHSAQMSCVALTTDEKILTSASADGTIKLWRPDRILGVDDHEAGPARHTEGVSGLLASSRSSWIASASEDYGVILWNGADGAAITKTSADSRFRAPIGGVAIAFSADEGRLFTGSPRGRIKAFQTTSPADEELIAHFEQTAVEHLATSLDGRWLLIALKHGPWHGHWTEHQKKSSIWLADLASQNALCEVRCGEGRAARIRSGHKGFDVIMKDGRFGTIDPAEQDLFRSELKIKGLIDAQRFQVGVITLTEGSEAGLKRATDACMVATPQAACLAVSSERDQAVVGDGAGGLWLVRDRDTGLTSVASEAHKGGVLGVCWIEPHLVISGGRDRTVAMWDALTWTLIDRFEGESAITHLCYAQGSGLIAAGEASGRVHFLRPQA